MEFVTNKVNFYYDPRRQGYSTAAWYTLSGTPAIVGTDLVLNNAGIVGRADIGRGEIIMAVTIPTDPTAGDIRSWGLGQMNLGAFAMFRITGTIFTAEVYDGYGNYKTEAITWDTNWAAAEVEYKIKYTPDGWHFYIAGVEKAFIQQLFTTAIAATTQATANTFTDAAHGLTNGEKIVLSTIDTTTGIDDKTIYFVVNTATNTFQLALSSDGDAVDLGTGDGTCNYQKFPDILTRKLPMSLYLSNGNADAMALTYINVLDAEVYSASVEATINVTADTEFPAAAAITDNFANPTTTNVASMGMVWDGATWDRLPGTSTDGVTVNLGSNNDVAVSSIVPGTDATNLGKAEDAAHTSGDVGVQILGVRSDTISAKAGTTGDYAPLQVNAVGSLYTHLTKADGTSIDAFGGADVDDAAFAVGTDKGQVVMGVATTDTVDSGDKAALAITTDRHLKNREQYAPSAEDNTNHVIYNHLRPVAVAVDANSNANIMTIVNSAALETNHVLKASAGRMYYIRAELDSTATTGTYYLQVYNAASLPADGAVTLLIAPIKVHHTNGVTSSIDIDRALYGAYAATGITVGWSTTQFTKTVIASAWGVFEGHVK